MVGHSVSLSDYAGRTVITMFGGKESADQVQRSAESVRGRYDPDELPILGISDLGAVPRPARIIVKGQLKKAFEAAVKDRSERLVAAGKPPLEDPAKAVVMLMDWKGEVAESFGLCGVDKQAVGVLIDGGRRILGSGTGAKAGEEILGLLAQQ